MSARQEIHALFVRPFLDEAEAALGRPAVDLLITELGTTRTDLDDPQGWLSIDLAGALVRRIVEATGDAASYDRAARLGFSSKYMGVLRPLIRAFSSPGGGYVQMCSNLPRFNKTGTIRVTAERPRSMTLEYRCLPGFTETTDVFCRGRIAQMRAFPSIFDLPLAELSHPQCMQHGADSCVYDVTWTERPPRLLSRALTVIGAVAGGAAAVALHAHWLIGVALALTVGLFAWSLARVLELRREIELRAIDVAEQNDALLRAAQANEERFKEVLEAKAGVERKVEERTHELSVTTTKLEETLLAVRELDQAKTDFFGNVSHDLRTPLTMILAPLDDMREGREPAGGTAAAVETMHRNAMRLLRLINQLLDLAKVDAGGTKLQRTLVDPAELARSVIAPFAAAASARKVTVAVSVPAPTAPLFADSGWLESALSNLIGNAMRFVSEGGHVTLEVVDHGHEVGFDVVDDGPGIAAADLPKLFERFAQGNDANARKGGTGIGLAIVREAARLHGGDATVTSEPGKGARFSLRLPRQAATEAELAADVTVQPNVTPARVLSQPSAAVDVIAPATALVSRDGPFHGAPLAVVVEDNDEIRALIANVLATRYRVREARNGREGLELLRSMTELPSIVVSDVSMPEMDGLQFVRALRADIRLRALPVVMLTARRDVTHVLEAFDAGADDYVTKPFHARELLARIDVRVRLNQLMSELAHRERLAALGVLAASVAHQIRNPLTSMRVGLPLMRAKLADKLDARSKEMLDVMIDGSERMERLTTDLLDLSRIDREVDGHCHPGEGLLAATRLISARLPMGVTLETKVDRALEMVARPGDLNQLFLNVLDNAARAVGERGTISVEAGREGDSLEVRIADSGPGIRTSIAPRIFQPFVTTRPAGEGTGLGLSIAKQIVDQHGGTITVGHSDLGGALFTVRLPLDRPASLPPPTAEAAQA